VSGTVGVTETWGGLMGGTVFCRLTRHSLRAIGLRLDSGKVFNSQPRVPLRGFSHTHCAPRAHAVGLGVRFSPAQFLVRRLGLSYGSASSPRSSSQTPRRTPAMRVLLGRVLVTLLWPMLSFAPPLLSVLLCSASLGTCLALLWFLFWSSFWSAMPRSTLLCFPPCCCSLVPFQFSALWL
jgi:hypothetical protein